MTYVDKGKAQSQMGKPAQAGGQSPTTAADEQERRGSQVPLVAAGSCKSIADAVDRVVLLYSYARRADVFDFIHAFCYRPIATMVDVLGGQDFKVRELEVMKSRLVRKTRKDKSGFDYAALYRKSARLEAMGPMKHEPDSVRAREMDEVIDREFGQASATDQATPFPGVLVADQPVMKKAGKYYYVRRWYMQTTYPSTGVEGFHSRAFGDKDQLFGLVGPKVKKILGLSAIDDKILDKMDTRKEKRRAVRTYLAALYRDKAVLG